MTDTLAIDLLKSGDESGFNHLYNTYRNLVQVVCSRFLFDKSEAEDATQEVFLRLYRKGSYFNGQCAVSTWLTQVAYNVCRDILRRRKCRIQLLDFEACPESGHSVVVHSIPTYELSALRRMILSESWDSLPERIQDDFTANVVYGHSCREVCEIRGVSLTSGAVQRIRKARKQTRSVLKEALA